MSSDTNTLSPAPLRDFAAGLVVCFVALPLCLGVALASGTPLFSGLLAGIIGGIVVGILSGSQTSVSGPSPAVIAVLVTQIAVLGSFQAFLLAVVFAGLIQVALGLARAGFLAAFVPSNVIKGLIAAVGIILILKQVPHILGHDPDPEGEMAFLQPDHESTFSELLRLIGDIHPGATAIGLASVVLLVVWDRWKLHKRLFVPAPLMVVLLGVVVSEVFRQVGSPWAVGPGHLVQVPVADGLSSYLGFLQYPDFSQWTNRAVYVAALTIAAVATLETLLNIEAVDKLDPLGRNSPPSRELLAQGTGNVVSGLIGGLPITSVIIRSSVNINAGGRTKLATIIHGALLLGAVVFLPAWLNRIPISCLAAILLVTGFKLASPVVAWDLWRQGRRQFAPFAVTVVAIVLTDLLVGILIGLAVSIAFILASNARRPLRRIVEQHLGGEVVRLELADQVSFLTRAALSRTLEEVPAGGHILLDAHGTSYIDPDVLDLIRDFKERSAPARGVEVSLLGFRDQYQLRDQTLYVDYSTREIQGAMSPRQVLQLLKEGHERFRSGRRLTRDLGRQVEATAAGQHPWAVVLSCIDSRTPVELIFDVGVGDVFSVRIAGNITSRKVLGSIEYACAVAGARLVLVMGHTRCGAVTAAVDSCRSGSVSAATGCEFIDHVVGDILEAIGPELHHGAEYLAPSEKSSLVDEVARRNVARVVDSLQKESRTLGRLAGDGRIAIVGAMYDVATGGLEFLTAGEPRPEPAADLV